MFGLGELKRAQLSLECLTIDRSKLNELRVNHCIHLPGGKIELLLNGRTKG